jgi:hypothetical protein
VRTAKLVIDGREYLSVLRDVSTTGCKVRLFHPLPLNAQEVALESAVGERFPMDLVWQRDDHAGFHFHNEIDVNRLIHDYHGDYPKRQIRLRTDVPAIVVPARAIFRWCCAIFRSPAPASNAVSG